MFNRLLPRFVAGPIDDDRIHGLIALNTVGGTALPISGIAFAGPVNALVVAVVDGSGNQITNFGAPSPTFVPITASAMGVTNLVAAQAGKSIRVLQVMLVSNGAVNVKFQSHVSPTDLTGLFYLVANTGFSSGYSPVGQFQTTSGEALDINLSGAVAVGGYLSYVLV
jgi:hypothetical protein